MTPFPDFVWPQMRQIIEAAKDIGSLELWLFGSAINSISPRDIDILVVYRDLEKLDALFDHAFWELYYPPVEITAMMPDEIEEIGLCKFLPMKLLLSF